MKDQILASLWYSFFSLYISIVEGIIRIMSPNQDYKKEHI